MCEVTKERVVLNYAILQNIKFDVRKIIEEAIWDKRDMRKKLDYSFLIYQLCKNAGVEISTQEEWLHPIKAIVVKKKGNRGLTKPKSNIDFGNEATNEDE